MSQPETNDRLWQFAQSLPSDNKFQAVFKSALFNKALARPLQGDEIKRLCRKCLTPWKDGYFTVVVLPASRKINKQLAKYERMPGKTAQQKSLMYYLRTRTVRMARYTCGICSHRTTLPLDDVAKRRPKANAAEPQHNTSVSKSPKQYVGNAQRPGKAKGKFGSRTTAHGNSQVTLTRTNNNFEPGDFRAIQRMLAEKMAGKKNTGNAPPGGAKMKGNKQKKQF